MFNKGDIVEVANYPDLGLVGKRGSVVDYSRLFVEVHLDDHKNTLFFRQDELDKVE